MNGMFQLTLLTAHISHNVGYHLLVMLIAGLAAFIPRYFPIRFFTSRKIPTWFNEWMNYVPVCLFTALVVKNIFVYTSNYTFMGLTRLDQIIAAVIVMGVAYITRSMSLSVVIGLVAVTLLHFIL